MKRSAFAVVTAIAFAKPAIAQVAPPPQSHVAIVNVNVIPMDREQVLTNHTVIFNNGKIVRVGPSASVQVPTGITTVNGSGKYLIPGLSEFHAHVPNASSPQSTKDRTLTLYVVNGVTTARSMLGDISHIAMRDRIVRGEQLGPRILASGPSFSGSTIRQAKDAADSVRSQKAAGYDLLKIHPGLSREAYDSLATTAKQLGIPYAGHVPLEVGWTHAAATGYSTIDHIDGIIEAMAQTNGALTAQQAGFFGLNVADAIDESKLPQLVEQAKNGKVWMVPTVALIDNWVNDIPSAELAALPEMKYWIPSQVRNWALNKNNTVSSPANPAAKRTALVAARKRALMALHKGGVGMLLGSDAPQVWNVPGFSVHRELQAKVDAGFSPFEALQTGTINVAKFLGEEATAGTIAEGKRADIILLKANPLVDIANSMLIDGVAVNGRWISSAEIARMLSELDTTQ